MVYRTYKSLSKYDEFSGDYIYYDKPQYSLDIYKWDGSSAKRILNKECVSVYFDDDTVFYLLLKKVKKQQIFAQTTMIWKTNTVSRLIRENIS